MTLAAFLSPRRPWGGPCPRTAHFRSLQVTRKQISGPPAGSLLGLCSHQGRACTEPGVSLANSLGFGVGGGGSRIDISVSD